MKKYFTATRVCKFLILYFVSFCGLLRPVSAQTRRPKPVAAAVQPKTLAELPNLYSEIDKKALLIPDSLTGSTEGISSYISANFNLNRDKVRAAFIWVASNIRYDVPNMYAINYYQKKEDKIAESLLTRRGICENYAALFADICQKTAIPAFVVEGYVKLNNQLSELSHAWCVARIDTTWYLFDPTWAAGYVNNGTFVPKINNSFYESDPSKFIEGHMPFDCLWQLLYHPISFTDFNNGKVKQNAGGTLFNFPDSIAIYEKLNQVQRFQASYSRIDNNGIKNAQVFNRLLFIRQNLEEAKTKQYNAAVADYNDAIANFNEFIRYRNKQFNPVKPDVDIQAMMDSASTPYNQAKTELDQIRSPGPDLAGSIGHLLKQMNDFSAQLEEQKAWLAKYFSKGKSGRRGMFNKVTWFGIPLN